MRGFIFIAPTLVLLAAVFAFVVPWCASGTDSNNV
jgi:hypothetical protein